MAWPKFAVSVFNSYANRTLVFAEIIMRNVFSARCNIYTSCVYATMSVSVCLWWKWIGAL